MTDGVKKRKYDASRRRAAAGQTKAAVLRAARELFTTRGYAGTPVAEIARAAGVSVDTLYETVGRKPQLLLAVHDMRLFAADLRTTGELRDKLDDDAVADLVWSMNALEYFQLLTSRGRTPEQYAAMVRDVWIRSFLRDPQAPGGGLR
jgi:AcrR family transcriptional regulator